MSFQRNGENVPPNSAYGSKVQANPPPKKKKNATVHQYFTGTQTLLNGIPYHKTICCRCNYTFQWKTVNATRMRSHIVYDCKKVTDYERDLVHMSSQKMTKDAKRHGILSCATNGTVSGESLTDIHHKRQRIGGSKSIQSLLDVRSYKKADYESIIMREVESICARFEPLSRLNDPMIHNALVQSHTKEILYHIPGSTSAIIDKYVKQIDRATKARLVCNLKAMRGFASIEIDGVSINGVSHVVYTMSKGNHSFYLKHSVLGSEVHEVSAEIDDAVLTIEETEKEYMQTITNIAVDNGATKMMEGAIKKFTQKHPEHPPITATRDPSHTIDLLAKDSTKVSTFDKISKDCVALITFFSNDKINGILNELVHTKSIESPTKVRLVSDTRFGKMAEYFKSLRTYKHFLSILPFNKKFVQVLSERKGKQKQAWNAALLIINHAFWLQVDACIAWFAPIERCQKISSATTFPMAAYLPLIQALRNELNVVMLYSFKEANFPPAFEKELAAFITLRFNMDGVSPLGTRKVGLLSKNQLWAYVVDPFRKKLKTHVQILPSLNEVMGDMNTFYSNNNFEAKDQLKSATALYLTRSGEWINSYHESEVLQSDFISDDPAVALAEQKLLRIDDVMEWVTTTNGIEGRLSFFCLHEHNLFTKRIAIPLMSFGTSGSMSVERTAKPLKRRIMIKERNRLSTGKCQLMLRVGLNLRYLVRSCQKIKETVYEQNRSREQHPSTNACAKNIYQHIQQEEEQDEDAIIIDSE